MTGQFDAIVLGGGAAGLMCALTAGARGRTVLVVEHAPEVGRKILISGGGRCNFTNLQAVPERYLSANPHFCRSALSRYTPQDFIDLVERHGIAWHEKTLGQLFCDGSARQIVALLIDECSRSGVHISCGQAVTEIDHADGLFRVRLGDRTAAAPALVIATGGPSIPKLGATAFAYDVARKFGLKLIEPRPALVPLTLSGDQLLFRTLSGVASEVVATCGKVAFREAALFTHRGLSGPAILQISSYWRPGKTIGIDFTPGRGPDWLVEAKRALPTRTVRRTLAGVLPERLAAILQERLGIDGTLGNISDRALLEAGSRLANWEFAPSGSEGFAKAEVTSGGIATDMISSKTMAAKSVPGLFAIGEAVDVTGWLGGYNFQWAWASGWAAGQAV